MIVAGFGFRAAATVDSLTDAYDRARGDLLADRLATAEDKAHSAVFCTLAAALALPVTGVAAESLQRVPTHTRSTASFNARNTGSVAEAAALAAAGPGARLVVARVVSSDKRATCALAVGGEP